MFYRCSTILARLKKKRGFPRSICPNVETNSYLCKLMRFDKVITDTTLHIMKQTKFNFSSRGYESPAVNVLDVMSEGVLCASGLGIQDWETDDETLEF